MLAVRKGLVAIVVAAVLTLAGCAQAPSAELERSGSGSLPEPMGEEIGMKAEERAVLESFEAMQQAMIDKDIDAMRALTTEDKTFTHMSGKTQTREQFFGEIADGTLNYFNYQIHDPRVIIEGDRATLTGSTTLDARVYGMSGSWTLPTNAPFVKQDEKWIQCN